MTCDRDEAFTPELAEAAAFLADLSDIQRVHLSIRLIVAEMPYHQRLDFLIDELATATGRDFSAHTSLEIERYFEPIASQMIKRAHALGDAQHKHTCWQE